MQTQLDKKDIFLIILLSTVFFAVGVSNLGLMNTPTTFWEASGGETLYLTLDSNQTISSVYSLIQGHGTLQYRLFGYQSDDWKLLSVMKETDYYKWKKTSIDFSTNQLKFEFLGPSVAINEIMLVGEFDNKLSILDIQCDTCSDNSFQNLIDEQDNLETIPTFLSETYFDEIYFVRTAQEHLEFNEPYENTHPPLGKLLIALSISLFGPSPFGWRLMGVLFATLMIPVIYLFGKFLFHSTLAGILSAYLLVFEFMHFTMSRIGTVDSFLVFFILVSTLFFYLNYRKMSEEKCAPDNKLVFLGVLFFSLAVSVKWVALFGFIGQVFLIMILNLKNLLNSKTKLTFNAVFLTPLRPLVLSVLVGVLIYFASFIPYMLIGHGFSEVLSRQWHMFSYHAGITSSHPFASAWWSWPFIHRPLWLYSSNLPNGFVSTIVVMGNPVIWWVGFPLILLTLWRGIEDKELTGLFLGGIYVFQLLPYLLISRVLFIYHYYMNVPILILTLVGFLSVAWNKRKTRFLAVGYLIFVPVVFILFYPVISGFPIPLWYRDLLKVFNNWIF